MNSPPKKVKRGRERRTENRLVFLGEIPGRLTHKSQELNFIPLDISRKGLGILLGPCPAEGEEILVEFKNNTHGSLRFTIKHIYDAKQERESSTQVDPAMQRCGIELTPGQQDSIDLIEILTRYS
ncbi:MAG: PilZ domain-containing protein [Chitinophagaceae bacterium]|nr:PilZ domain-containing protein [Oligoflexus sp.]